MKTMAILFLGLLMLSCGDKKDKTEEGAQPVNIENVEGSMPDTTSGAIINQPDTTRKDSL